MNHYPKYVDKNTKFALSQGIPSVPRIKEGPNPASWVLDISSHTTEYDIGVDYAEIYRSSDLYR